MAASAPLSSWILNKGLACFNWNWTADSGGLCNSQGIINEISGRVVQLRLVTANTEERLSNADFNHKLH